MAHCEFCAIGAGEVDADLAVRATPEVFVLPALRQRPRNRGHTLVLPVAHVRNLHDAPPQLLTALAGVTARLTAAFPALYRASGSLVFQNNFEPDDEPFHLHIHAVPRFDDDDFVLPDPVRVQEVPRPDRLAQADQLRKLLVSAP